MLRNENMGVACARNKNNWHAAGHVTIDNTDCGSKRILLCCVCYSFKQFACCILSKDNRLSCEKKTWVLHLLYMQAIGILHDMLQQITQTVVRNENMRVSCATHATNWHAARRFKR